MIINPSCSLVQSSLTDENPLLQTSQSSHVNVPFSVGQLCATVKCLNALIHKTFFDYYAYAKPENKLAKLLAEQYFN